MLIAMKKSIEHAFDIRPFRTEQFPVNNIAITSVCIVEVVVMIECNSCNCSSFVQK